MWRTGCVLLLATLCVAQRPQSSSGERQIRLEDIERDNLAASQKPASSSSSQPQQQQQPVSNTQHQQQQQQQQQQLAAYQQQLLLQQLQQQYFAPAPPLAYGNFGGVPLMIIHSNHLGAGNPSGVPIQAYFVPTEPQYLPQYQHPLYQPFPRYQVPAHRLPVQRVPVPLTPDLTYNSVQQIPSVQTYRQSQNYPSASVVYAGTPVQSAQNYQQPQSQQLYNAYNALYQQQRQEKNTFGVGVKSTPAPPHKSQSQIYTSPSLNSAQYSTLKSYNFNQ